MAFFAKVFVSLLVRLPRILKSFFDHGIWRLIRPFTQIPVEPLILGTSTWGFGDLQEDWDAFLGSLTKMNLTGKTIALFGLGDSSTYSDTFVDGMGIIYRALLEKGCKFIGKVDRSNYSFDSSEAEIDGELVGLALDEDSESQKTSARLDEWLKAIKLDIDG